MRFKIGDIIGTNNSLEVIGYRSKRNKKERGKYVVKCHICAQDPELNGDAIYEMSADYVNSNKLPCSCSKSEKRTKAQWEVLIKRKAVENNHFFIDFVDDYQNQNSKLHLKCGRCNSEWKSCSVGNYLRNRGCPTCANYDRVKNKITSSDVWINRFLETGKFNSDYNFKRQTERSRLWEVTCKKCGTDKVFISDRSNLVAGKVPCDCNLGGGYDKSLTGYFYLLTFEINNEKHVGYGITNFPHRRFTDHKRELGKAGGSLQEIKWFTSDGVTVLAIETLIKQLYKPSGVKVTGFVKESTSLDNLQSILDMVNQSSLLEYLPP